VEASGPGESPWQGLFHLENGIVLSCLLLNKVDGRVILRDNEALHWLTNQEKLEWRLDEGVSPPESLPQLSPPGTQAREEQRREDQDYGHDPLVANHWKNQLSTIPIRTQKGSAVPANAFALRDHRQVLALVDGQRTIAEIAQLLNKSPQTVLYVLQELRASGFIG
jgi:hypothetical protein